MPTQTIATGGFCSVVDAMVEVLLVLVMLGMGLAGEMCWILGMSSSQSSPRVLSQGYSAVLSMSPFNVDVVVVVAGT